MTMEIPDGHFVVRCDLDDPDPYCIILANDKYASVDEIKVLIPKELAFYLSRHFCGSHAMQKTIEENEKRRIVKQIKDAFGIKESQ